MNYPLPFILRMFVCNVYVPLSDIVCNCKIIFDYVVKHTTTMA